MRITERCVVSVVALLAPIVAASATAGEPGEGREIDLAGGGGLVRVVSAEPRDHSVAFATPPGPAMGLGDHGGQHPTLDVTGFGRDAEPMVNLGGRRKQRFFSTFVIWPRGGDPARPGGPRRAFAAAVLDPSAPIVTIGADAVTLTATNETDAVFWSELGTVDEVYASWKHARERMGFPGVRPRREWFGLGWESWDALRWNTNAATVRASIERWRDLGFPIRWAVTGSGFWSDRHSTTSFGRWHEEKYPDPEGLRAWFDERGIAWLIGGRTNFVLGGREPPDSARDDLDWRSALVRGPFTDDALARGFFYGTSPGVPLVVTSSAFPRAPSALLDGRDPSAARWFADRWGEWGVDGVKEDTMMPVPDASIYNGPMRALAQRGQLVMARNAAFTSPGTLTRIEDMQFIDAMTGRVPRNFQQLAASAAPNVYVDTVGFGGVDENPVGAIRHAWLSALTVGMAVGALPDSWSDEQLDALRAAARFHLAIGPTLFDAAVESYETGAPATMTPLPIAFPHDDRIARLAGSEGSPLEHQWMIGRSLLAAPLAHGRYRETDRRDVYVPAGRWFDLATGEHFEGPRLLTDHAAPLAAPPVFVGGPGVFLTESEDGELVACVYPTARAGESVEASFTVPGGGTVTIARPAVRTERARWLRPVVAIGATGERVPIVAPPYPGALAFRVTPGHRYAVVDD